MKTLFLSMLALLIIVDTASALSIKKPQNGDIYLVGQTLTMELQVLPDEDIEQIIISSQHFSGAIIVSAPFSHDFKLDSPVDGQEKIGVVGVLKNGETILLSTYIYVKLPNDLELKDIILEEPLALVIMTPSGVGEDTIKADGIFVDGSRYPINSYSKIKYNISDETIAKVDSVGVITGVSPGSTTVRLSAGSITKEINVKVIYKIDSVKGIAVIAYEKANEIKWEKSPYEGDIVSGYKVYRSEGELGKYGVDKIMIGNVSTGVNNFVDTQIKAGIKYYYSVEAFLQKYNSGSSMKGLWIRPSASPQPAIQ